MASQNAGRTAGSTKKSTGKSSGRKTSSKKTSNTKKRTSASATKQKRTSHTGTASKGRSSAAGSRTGRMTKEEYIKKSGMYDEIKLLVSLAVALIMLISIMHFGGTAGNLLSSFLFGIFGWLAYVMPFVTFFGTAFMISNKKNRIARKKLLSFILFIVFLMAFLQMVASPYDASTKLADYYHNCSVYRNGGGIIGGVICYALIPLFGKVGSYIIIIICMALGFVLLTQKAVFSMVIQRLVRWFEEYRAYRQEKNRIREEMLIQEELEREDEYEEDLDDEEMDDDDDDFVEERYTLPHRKKHPGASKKRADSQNPEESDRRKDKGGWKPVTEPEVTAQPEYHTAMTEDTENQDIPVTPVEPVNEGQPVFTVTRMEPITFEEVEDVEEFQTPKEPEPILDEEEEDLTGQTSGDYSAYDDVDIPAEYAKGGQGQSTPADTTASQSGAAQSQAPAKATPADTTPVTAEEITPPVKEYVFPPYTLLKKGDNKGSSISDEYLAETAQKLQSTLDSFGVKVQVTNVSCGPSVTRYELSPEQGVKVSRIVALADDIKLNLAVADIRIEAPIPGKAAVGIEVPNKENTMVLFRDLLESRDFKQSTSNVSFAVGRDIGGQVIVTDIAKMPHLLIAGATGSGKSVCINTLIMSIIYKSKPEDVRLIMVDPKVVELSVYNGIPHLMIPVVTDPKKAAGALNWAVQEMTVRYNKFAELGVRNIKGYNDKIEASEYESENYQKMPQIVIIVDELADLMMVASSEVEDAICRLAQLARAAGIHLVIATQRPSVNVITGVIKANIPSRIAFAVSSGVDSRTILDMNGAEKLLGKGDMLFYPAGMQKPIRVQGAFISDKEINDVVEFLSAENETVQYNTEVADQISSGGASMDNKGLEYDQYFADAGRFIIEKDKASIGMLQRVYKIGFNRAARIMDQLCEAGVVGPEEGTKPRKIIMSAEEFEQYVDEYV